MSPSASRSVPSQLSDVSRKSFITIGPNPDDPDMILLARLHTCPPKSHAKSRKRPAAYRAKIIGNPLQTDVNVSEFRSLLYPRLIPLILEFNECRPHTNVGGPEWEEKSRATWQSVVERHVDILFKETTEQELTLVVCSSNRQYKDALTQYSAVPPPSRTVNDYKAGHEYDYDPGSLRPEEKDEWERRSQ